MAAKLFEYLDDKDVFARHTCRFMAKRLLQGSSLSMEHEQALVSTIRQYCGGGVLELGSRLQRMCADKLLAVDLAVRFEQYAEARVRGAPPPEVATLAGALRPVTTEISGNDLVVGWGPASPSGVVIHELTSPVPEEADADAIRAASPPNGSPRPGQAAVDGLLGAQSANLSDAASEDGELALAEEGTPPRWKQQSVVMEVLVLTAGAWPVSQHASSSAFQLPPELAGRKVEFSDFYGASFSGRKLDWLHHLSKAEVYYWPQSGRGRRVELVGTAHQIAALMLFDGPPDSDPTFSLAELAARLGLGIGVTTKLVQSLHAAKVLRLVSPDQPVVPADEPSVLGEGTLVRRPPRRFPSTPRGYTEQLCAVGAFGSWIRAEEASVEAACGRGGTEHSGARRDGGGRGGGQAAYTGEDVGRTQNVHAGRNCPIAEGSQAGAPENVRAVAYRD
jgi:hypothetical protein